MMNLKKLFKIIGYGVFFVIIFCISFLLLPLNITLKMMALAHPSLQKVSVFMHHHSDFFTKNNGSDNNYNTLFSGEINILPLQKYGLTQVNWRYTGTFSQPLQWNISSIDLVKPVQLTVKPSNQSISFTGSSLNIPLKRIQGLLLLSKTLNVTGNAVLNWNAQNIEKIENNIQNPQILQAHISFIPLTFEYLGQQKINYVDADINASGLASSLALQITTPKPEISDYIFDGTLNYGIENTNHSQWTGHLTIKFPEEDNDFMMNQVLPFLPQNDSNNSSNQNIQFNLEKQIP